MPSLLLAALLVPALQPAASSVQDDARTVETRRYDVRALLSGPPQNGDRLDMRLPGRASRIDSIYLDDDDFVDASGPAATGSIFVDALDGYLSRSGHDFEPPLVIQRGWLEVNAPSETQDVVQQLVADWFHTTQPAVVVEALWIPRDGFGPVTSGLLSAEEATALFADAVPSARGFARTPFGRPVQLGRPSRELVLADYDVEVAQYQFIIDPTVTWVQEGAALGVRVDAPALGSRLVVRAWGRGTRSLGAPRRVALTDFGNSEIDLPHVASSIWTSSARLEPGGALLIDTSDADGHVVAVRVQAPGGRPEIETRHVELGVLGSPRLFIEPYWLGWPTPSRGLDQADEEWGTLTSPWMSEPLDPVEEVLRRLDLQGRVHAWEIGTRVLLEATPGERLRFRDELSRLAAETCGSTLSVEFAAGDVATSQVGSLWSEQSALTAFVERASIRMAGNVLEGDALMLLAGDERAYVADFDAQIAGGGAVGDPIVRHLFQGTRFWLSPVHASRASVRAWIDVDQRFGAGLPQQREVNATNRGRRPTPGDRAPEPERIMAPLELVRTDARGGRALVDLEPGHWHLAFVDPEVREGEALAVALRVRVIEP